MRKYELMFILSSTLEEEKKAEMVETVKGIIAEAGTVDKVDVWGMRKLAYPIQKKNDGYYVVVDFTGPKDLPKEVDRRLKISEAVIRHMIIAKDEK